MQASVVFAADGTAFLADMAGTTQAVAPTGELRWRCRLEAAVSATPVLDPADRVLFVGTHGGEVVALDAATGAVRWRRQIPSRRDPRILSDFLFLPRAGMVLFSSWSGRFHALDAASGEPRAEWDAGNAPRSAASADAEERVYFLRASAGRGIDWVRVRPAAGAEEEVLHREPEDSRGGGRALVAAPPVIDEARGTILLVLHRERAGRLMAWSMAEGTFAWTRDLPASVQAAPALLAGGEVALGDLAGVVHGWDAAGTPLFRTALGCDYLLAGVVGVGADAWVVGDPLGSVRSLDRRGRITPLLEAPRSFQAQPSLDPFGRLVLPCTDHTVYVMASRSDRSPGPG